MHPFRSRHARSGAGRGLTCGAGARSWNRALRRSRRVAAIPGPRCVRVRTCTHSDLGTPDPEQAADLLAERALEAGIERFVDRDELQQFLARVAFASEHAPIPISARPIRSRPRTYLRSGRSKLESSAS